MHLYSKYGFKIGVCFFIQATAALLPAALLPRNLKREQLIPLPSSWLKNKGCYDFPLHDRSPKVIFQMFFLFPIIVYTEGIVNVFFAAPLRFNFLLRLLPA